MGAVTSTRQEQPLLARYRRVLTFADSLAEIQSGRLARPSSVAEQTAALVAESVLSMLFFLLWSSAAVVATDTYLRGGEPHLRPVYGTALRRYWAVLLASIALLVA